MKLENHYLSILESLHDPVIIISDDRSIVFVNKAYEKQFNVLSSKVIGRDLKQIEPNSRILDVLRDGEAKVNDFSYVESLQQHIYANITPLIENEKIIGVVTIMKDISETQKLEKELNEYKRYSIFLKKQLESKNYSKLKTQAPKMTKAVEMTKEIAMTDANVVLYGESGVGKEIFAKAIHESGKRYDKPFIPINMSSIPESLFESELFGYEDGSFTGSRSGGKKGLLEMANKGTILFDEIGELSLNNQTKLLRVIQERNYYSVGGTKLKKFNARIICATNRDLQKEVTNGRFREDLFYRIHVVPITIPPLRERREDIEYLATIILGDILLRYNKNVTIDSEVFSFFRNYTWPGNVRELTNILERMVALTTKSVLEVTDLPEHIKENITMENEHIPTHLPTLSSDEFHLKDIIDQTEKQVIKYVVKTSKNKSEAILKLGISRKTFYKKIKKYDIN